MNKDSHQIRQNETFKFSSSFVYIFKGLLRWPFFLHGSQTEKDSTVCMCVCAKRSLSFLQCSWRARSTRKKFASVTKFSCFYFPPTFLCFPCVVLQVFDGGWEAKWWFSKCTSLSFHLKCSTPPSSLLVQNWTIQAWRFDPFWTEKPFKIQRWSQKHHSIIQLSFN